MSTWPSLQALNTSQKMFRMLKTTNGLLILLMPVLLKAMDLVESVTWNISYMGYANISVKAMNLCGDGLFSENLEVQLDNTTDVAELSAQDMILVYPNPNQGNFNILASSQIANANIMVYNMVGEKVFSHQANMNNGETMNIGLENYPKGLYILSVITADFRFTEKLIIK